MVVRPELLGPKITNQIKDSMKSLAFAVAKNIFCELVLAVTISFLKLSMQPLSA